MDSRFPLSSGTFPRADTPAIISPTSRNVLILITLSILTYPFLPTPSHHPSSPSASPDAFSQTTSDDSVPWLTRWLAGITPKAEVWTKRNDKHLELSKATAEDRLLVQEAERPKVRRLKYPRCVKASGPSDRLGFLGW